jgi:hypothetical protein
MRTSTSLTQNEVDAYMQFAAENKIITVGDVGVRNADILCNPIIDRNSDITPQTLSLSFLRVKDQLRLKSAAQSRAGALAHNLSSTEVEAYRNWASHQSRWIGLDGSEEGFENCASLLAWMRGNPVTEHTLDLALGNIINNPQFGTIHFKPQPKQDRSIGPGGRLNHSIVNKSEEGFMPRSQTNRTHRQVLEESRPKPETAVPVSVNPDYRARAESVQGRSHGQTDVARKLFVMIPGTSDIDWQQTLAAREKFLNTQVALVRRR